MSQQRATTDPSSSNGTHNTTDQTPATASGSSSGSVINLDDSDDGTNDVEFVSIETLRPITATIDLCVSPSTSAAAAAAASSSLATASASNSGETHKTANTEAGEAAAALECPICLQTCIHPARLPCGHIFCFLCVKGVAYKNRRCAMCRREIPPEFLDHPQLVNGISDICATRATEDGYQWYYEGRNGWWQYDDRTSQDIEEAFKKGEKSCTILVAGYVYIVDLETLVQQRQNEPTRCRRVKRDLATIPKKGVAGLRIEGNTVATDTHFTQQSQLQRLRHTQPTVVRDSSSTPAAASLISTIAATDAAIRIASDIIGSTLAHADELTRNLTASNISDSVSDLSGEHLTHTNHQVPLPVHRSTAAGPQSSFSEDSSSTRASLASSSSHSNSIQDLMRSATEDLLDTTQQVIETHQHTIDLFEQALNDFQALTLRNFVDSSDDDEDGVGHADEEEEDLEAGEPPAPPPPILPHRNRHHSDDDNGPLGF